MSTNTSTSINQSGKEFRLESFLIATIMQLKFLILGHKLQNLSSCIIEGEENPDLKF